MWPGLGLQSLCNVDWYVLWNVRYCPLILSNTVGRESMFAAIPFARMTCVQLVLVGSQWLAQCGVTALTGYSTHTS